MTDPRPGNGMTTADYIRLQRELLDTKLNQLQKDVDTLQNSYMSRESIEGRFDAVRADIAEIKGMVKELKGEGPTLVSVSAEQMHLKTEQTRLRDRQGLIWGGAVGALGLIWAALGDKIKGFFSG